MMNAAVFKRTSLAAMMALALVACGGGGGELCSIADGGWLAHLCGHRAEYADGAGIYRLGGG